MIVFLVEIDSLSFFFKEYPKHKTMKKIRSPPLPKRWTNEREGGANMEPREKMQRLSKEGPEGHPEGHRDDNLKLCVKDQAFDQFMMNVCALSTLTTSMLLMLANTSSANRKAVQWFCVQQGCNLMAPKFKKRSIKSQTYDLMQIIHPGRWLTKKEIEALANRTSPMGSDTFACYKKPSRFDDRYLVRERRGRTFVYTIVSQQR